MAIRGPQLEHKIRLAKKELERGSPHVKWYVEYLDSVIEEKESTIREYQDFFKKLDKFLPNKNHVYKEK